LGPGHLGERFQSDPTYHCIPSRKGKRIIGSRNASTAGYDYPHAPNPFPAHRELLLNTCHLSAIAARLGRAIKWDPKVERIIGDEQAAAMIAREPRKGFEIPRV